MRESQPGRKSFPGGRRFLEEPSLPPPPTQSPRYPGRSLFTSLEDDRNTCFYPCWVTLKLPASRNTRKDSPE